MADGKFAEGGPSYRYWRARDTRVMRAASAVICIAEALRGEVIERGVPANRVFLAPNAVDPDVFSAAASDAAASPEVAAVRARLDGPGPTRRRTLGYVGNVRRLEGVAELVRGAAAMVRRGREVSLLVVGDGPALEEVRALAAELGLGDRAVFTGRVPHADVIAYYRLIDVFVVSRPALRVTELVTPLKPLEAMALGVPVVASNLAALRELIRDGETGLLYRAGSPDALADRCALLLDDEAMRSRLADGARSWTRTERTWAACLRGLEPAYRRAMASPGTRA